MSKRVLSRLGARELISEEQNQIMADKQCLHWPFGGNSKSMMSIAMIVSVRPRHLDAVSEGGRC